jgi:hypothetical protein
VPDLDDDPALAQAPDVRAVGDVATLHTIAQVMHHLRDTAHADAADADEMNRSDVQR